ncbi:glycosytransferase [Listeria floridensis FSL S10-1187]|uniref:Glycosytransferase n=1 Tax=Listeria floridensis FSL S10-1187 TaxID=1265817 RepID=A0ABN0REL6_9LIST|nr:glycosyltransferase family 4 protein [Listeria floridensis]EUJ31350.1 glycosytransferase [Listeria floridensis FSL S10-1187]
MNILMVGPDPEAKGGMATVISNFKKYYAHPNQKLYFFTTWSETQKKRTQWRALTKIRKEVKRNKIDVVHFHVAQKGSFIRKALLKRLLPKRCKTIFHMHASQFEVFYQTSGKWMKAWIRSELNDVDQLVVLSEGWAAFYRSLTDTDIAVSRNAVQVPEESLYHAEAKTIVTFGRIGQRKGSYDLLAVAKRIRVKVPEVRFVLYGDGETGKVAEQIEAEQIDNVLLGGWISKVEQAEVMQHAALHFLPSYHEGLPMAILETMAAGVPNLATNVGGISEAVQHGENGMIVEPGNIEAMVLELERFLLDEKMRKRYSKNARLMIENEFSFERYFKSWADFYPEL